MDNTENSILEVKLEFAGPFSFINDDKHLFSKEFAREGIYLWTIKDIKTNRNIVHYIGESSDFLVRQRTHFLSMMGFNYLILDAKDAKNGIETILWNGAWRDKSNNFALNILDNYSKLHSHLLDYIEILNVYFAPTNLTKQNRKHIEACIAQNIRAKGNETNVFYKKDNITFKPKNINTKIQITSNEKIEGLDNIIELQI